MKTIKSTCKSVARTTKPITGRSDWFLRIDQLGNDFEAYQSAVDPEQKKRLENNFYQRLWELAARRSKNLLYSWTSKGDPTQDAMDITGLFVEGVLKQEMNWKGLFNPTPRTPVQLRGYLNYTIRKGVFQQATEFIRKQRSWLSFDDEPLESAVATPDSDWETTVTNLAGKIAKVRKQQKVPPNEIGTTSLDLVLQIALDQKICRGGQIKELLPSAGLPTRTQQRREQKFRADLRRELDI